MLIAKIHETYYTEMILYIIISYGMNNLFILIPIETLSKNKKGSCNNRNKYVRNNRMKCYYIL